MVVRTKKFYWDQKTFPDQILSTPPPQRRAAALQGSFTSQYVIFDRLSDDRTTREDIGNTYRNLEGGEEQGDSRCPEKNRVQKVLREVSMRIQVF